METLRATTLDTVARRYVEASVETTGTGMTTSVETVDCS
jgi:hypothetical protein